MAKITSARIYHKTGPSRYCCQVKCSDGVWYEKQCWEHTEAGKPPAPYTTAESIALATSCRDNYLSQTGMSCPWNPEVAPPPPPPPPPPLKVCTPGEKMCMNGNLYECDSAGENWILIASNSPICEAQGACPDFWTNPVGATWCWIMSGLENVLNLVSGGFLTLAANINNFLNSFSLDITNFFADPISKVRSWVLDLIPTLADWWNDILTGVGTWWESTSLDVKAWINDALGGFNTWIDEGFSNIGSWWSSTATSVHSWINSAVSNITDFYEAFPIAISSWYNSNIGPIIDTVNGTINDLQEWIGEGFSNIGKWWESTWTGVITWFDSKMIDAFAWFTSSFQDFLDFIGEIPLGIADYIGTVVLDIQDWTKGIVPGIVSGMFEWAKPVIQPVIDAAGWIGEIAGILTGTRPKEQEIKDTEETIQEHYDAVKEILEGME